MEVPQSHLWVGGAQATWDANLEPLLTNVALAERVGLSPSPCLARIRALEETGVIARRVTLLDAAKLGPSLSVFIQVTLENRSRRCWRASSSRSNAFQK
jgi:DNA-binding Lrp family transcriptional regulator